MRKILYFVVLSLSVIMLQACGQQITRSPEITETVESSIAPIKTDKVVWPVNEITEMLPVPPSDSYDINYDKETGFSVNIENMSSEQYLGFLAECKDKEFTIEYSNNDNYYSAYNESGFYLLLKYDSVESILSLQVNAPESGDLTWPDSELASLIPVPTSVTGTVWSNTPTELIITVGKITSDEFTKYINECRETWVVDYEGMHLYAAYNENNKLSLIYTGGDDTMHVRINTK